jgi:hypothetical protein
VPGIAIIKCSLCEHKGPLLRGSEKAVSRWLANNGWQESKKRGLICKRCVRGLKEDESPLQRCERKTAARATETERTEKKLGRKQKRRRAPRVEVLTETHLPAKFHTQQRIEWDGKSHGWGWLKAEIVGVRTKLGHYRYKIRLDATIKRLLTRGRFGELEVPETSLRINKEAC